MSELTQFYFQTLVAVLHDCIEDYLVANDSVRKVMLK
jgi:hypothetical protein